MVAIGLALGALIGVALGLMGGGGSILTVPIFVYVLGFGAKQAIALSLAVVGVVSAFGVVGHWRAGSVNVRVALVFGVVAMAGTYGGARLAVFLSGTTQLLLFAGVMLAAAYFMFRRPGAGEAGAPGEGVAPGDAAASRSPSDLSGERGRSSGRGDLRLGLIVVEGLAVGVLTGLVGVGGGFLIVPALVLLAGLPMKEAVGTSLAVIVLKSAAGFYGYLGQVEVPWAFLGAFTAVAVVGIVLGTYLVRHVSQAGLRKAFAAFLVVMGGFILFQNRAVLIGGDDGASDRVESVSPGGAPGGSAGSGVETNRTETDTA